jgi:NitT/TauT family transport system permease protein
MSRSERIQSFILGVVGILMLVGLWEIAGQLRWLGMTLPPFSAIVAFIGSPQRMTMLSRAIAATSLMVALGFFIGAATGIGTAVLVHFFQKLKPGLDRFASLLHSIPTIALAPIFIVLTSRDYTGVALAGISVFFITYVATASGLEETSRTGRDLFQVFGAPSATRFLYLELPSALPALASGLTYAVPTAFIGEILGEWFGASRGIGLLMVTAMQNLQIAMLWSSVIVTSFVSLIGYGLMTQVERFVQRRFR